MPKKNEEKDSITFDFKNPFGKKKVKEVKIVKEDSPEDVPKDEEMNIDLKSITEFFKKASPVLLILIPIIIAIFLRAMPAYLPITDDWAKQTVYQNIQSQIQQSIDSQYFNLPPQTKADLVNKNFNSVLIAQKDTLNSQIKDLSGYFKTQFQDENNNMYLGSIDPYYYLRLARNYQEHGYEYDIETPKGYIETHSYAGLPVDELSPTKNKVSSLTTYIIYYVYEIISFFGHTSIIVGAFYFPLILGVLSVIPAFFIGRKFAGNIGGLFASLIIAIHPVFMARSVAGFADTDVYQVFFPLFVLWLLIEAFYAKSHITRLILTVINGLIIGVFAFAWTGWWYLPLIIFIGLITSIGYYLLFDIIRKSGNGFKKNRKLIGTLIILVVLFFSSLSFVTWFTNFDRFDSIWMEPIGFTKFKQVGITTLWPNVFTTVAEENPLTINEMIGQLGMGYNYLFILALTGMLIYAFKNNKELKNILFIVISMLWYATVLAIPQLHNNFYLFAFLISLPIFYMVIISLRNNEVLDADFLALSIVWLFATIYAGTIGGRFTLLLIPLFAVTFGFSVGWIYQSVKKWISKEMNIQSSIVAITIIVLISLTFIGPVQSAYGAAKNEVPMISDAWVEMLKDIESNSSKTAIINSWWDYGHWFKYYADRPVTLDGGIQNNPQAHWLGKIMLTTDEDMSVGVLKMLDCGATKGFDVLNKYNNEDTVKSIDILNIILPMNDRADAQKYLSKYFSDSQTVEILKYTHCENPPEDFFITSEDMVQKSGVWAHFGAWDFKRAAMYNAVKKETSSEGVSTLMKNFNLDQQAADQIYYEVQTQDANNWIAPWPSYYGTSTPCNENKGMLICGNGLQLNLSDHAGSYLSQSGWKKPYSIVYLDNESKLVETDENLGGELSFAVYKDVQNATYSIGMDPKLSKSMFTRLFFFRGESLKHFELFTSKRSVLGEDLYTWKINWNP